MNLLSEVFGCVAGTDTTLMYLLFVNVIHYYYIFSYCYLSKIQLRRCLCIYIVLATSVYLLLAVEIRLYIMTSKVKDCLQDR